MPVKDSEEFLEVCITSILNQTFTNWELIVVENGSDDRSTEIVTRFAKIDSRIHFYQIAEADLLGALRLGYQHSKGRLIHRMDSDDQMSENKLELMYHAISDVGRKNVITGDVQYFSNHGELGEGFQRYANWISEVNRKQSHRIEMYKECVVPSSCWLIHREDFDEINGFEPDERPEDYDLCFRMIGQGYSIIALENILHYWRDHPNRISRTVKEYADYRFLPLKTKYFLKLERESHRPLVLWGAGKNGKDLAKLLIDHEEEFIWICNNDRKLGKEIYGKMMKGVDDLSSVNDPQIIVAVASPEDQSEITAFFTQRDLRKGQHYWFFS